MSNPEEPEQEQDIPRLRVAISPGGIMLVATMGDQEIPVELNPEQAIQFAGLIQAHSTIFIYNQLMMDLERREAEEEVLRNLHGGVDLSRLKK